MSTSHTDTQYINYACTLPPSLSPSPGGLDFNVPMSQLVITPENTDYTVPVTINHDSNVEDDEMFSVVLSTDEDGVRIDPNTAEITITDASEWAVQYMMVSVTRHMSSLTAVEIVVSEGPYTSPEGEVVEVSVLATNPAGRTVTVDVMSVGGTAGEYITY